MITADANGFILVRIFEPPPPVPAFAKGGLAKAARHVRAAGRGGDDYLVHMNRAEYAEMCERFGQPTINPETGIPEWGLFKKIGRGLKKLAKSKLFRVLAPIVLSVVLPGLGTAIGASLGASGAAAGMIGNAVLGGAMGAATGGGWKGALTGAIGGGITGGAGGALGRSVGLTGTTANVAGNALLSGAMNKAQGGDFIKGALTGGALTYAAPYIDSATGTNYASRATGIGGQAPTAAAITEGTVGFNPSGASSGLEGTVGFDAGIPRTPSMAQAMSAGSGSAASGIPAMPSYRDAVSNMGTQAASAPASTPGFQMPATQNPSQRGVVAGLVDYAKENPMEALGVMSALSGSTSSQQQSGPPPLPDYMGEPLPQLSFSRTRNNDIDYYNYGTRPQQSFFGNNSIPSVGNQAGAVGGSPWATTDEGVGAAPSAASSLRQPNLGVPTGMSSGQVGGTSWSTTDRGNFVNAVEGVDYRRVKGQLMALTPLGQQYVQAIRSGQKFARGGAASPRYVSAGTGAHGRADNIEALLSENEYVFDAETVALLGDGSPEAGARKLDEMRARIRAHKGKALSKGKISPDAKGPMAYLRDGGRVKNRKGA